MSHHNILQSRSYGKALVGASLIALSSLSTPPAFAQSTPPATDNLAENDDGLGDIIVTARKVAEKLQDVPVAVTAFSGADLVAQNVLKAQDIARFTPGMTIKYGGSSPSAFTIAVRGQVQSDILATLDPSVGTYVDGVYWARAYGLNADLLDVQSVQILKGPQGTLFGRNTTGGALLIDSNDPSFDGFSGSVSATYGRFNEASVTGIANLPIIEDKAALRVALMRSKRDGYTRNLLNGRKYDDRDRFSGRAKLLVEPTQGLSLLFSAEVFNMDEALQSREIIAGLPAYTATNPLYSIGNTGPRYVGLRSGASAADAVAAGITILNNQAASLATNPSTTMSDAAPRAYAHTETYGFTGAVDTDFGQIKLITGYRAVKSLADLDLEGSSYDVLFTENTQRLKQWSGELQITGNAFDDRVDFAGGAFLFHESGYDTSSSVTAPTINAVTSHTYGIIKNNSSGIYGQASWHITDKLTFTGGLRYSSDEKGLELRNNSYNRTTGITSCSIVPGVTVATAALGPAQCAARRSDTFNGWSYTAGFDYKPAESILVYLKTAKGLRSGGQNLRAPSLTFFLPFNPEVAYSYEAGLKSQFFGDRVRLNLAAYTTTVNNIQRTTLIAAPTGSGTATIIGNAGKARFNGLEVELMAQLFTGFRLSMTGALVDPKYIDYADASGDRSADNFTNIAKKSFTVAGDYSTDIGSAKLKLRADYSWLSKQHNSDYNWVANPSNATIIDATTVKSFGTLGARASVAFDDGKYEIAVYGRNLTNNRGFSSILLTAPLGFISGARREPITYGLTGTLKF